jgi:site-specific DNA-cytosine methylase
MSKPNVLIINSFAGSLTIAARQAGHDILGSYEDEGYGLPIQKENFPEVNYRETLSSWPTQDLSETIVLGHPHCAAFSQQNNSANAKGLDAKKFKCTLNVLEYAFKNKALALAIESVPRTLEGARMVHDNYADQYGYDVFRILQNSITFGLPQWRPRFWIIFVKKGVISELVLNYTPVKKPIKMFLDHPPTEVDHKMDEELRKQKQILTDSFGADKMAYIMDGFGGGGGLPALIKKNCDVEGDAGEIAKKYCVGGNFMSHCLRILDRDGFATTLLFDSWWAVDSRNLSRREYKKVMGFPADYKFPDKYAPKFREYLSRGVCPPVAEWVLNNLSDNILRKTTSGPVHRLGIGRTLDLNIIKGEFGHE